MPVALFGQSRFLAPLPRRGRDHLVGAASAAFIDVAIHRARGEPRSRNGDRRDVGQVCEAREDADALRSGSRRCRTARRLTTPEGCPPPWGVNSPGTANPACDPPGASKCPAGCRLLHVLCLCRRGWSPGASEGICTGRCHLRARRQCAASWPRLPPRPCWCRRRTRGRCCFPCRRHGHDLDVLVVLRQQPPGLLPAVSGDHNATLEGSQASTPPEPQFAVGEVHKICGQSGVAVCRPVFRFHLSVAVDLPQRLAH